MTLVITRKPGQQIRIGDDILVTVMQVSETGQVRVGIDAPRELRVSRVDGRGA